jgi:hypothetical protein
MEMVAPIVMANEAIRCPIGWDWAESEKMIGWRLAVSASLGATVVAGCIVYIVARVPSHQVEAGQRLSPTVRKAIDRNDAAVPMVIQPAIREDHVTAYQRAAEAILKRAQSATAFADMPLTGRIPLPRRRPTQHPWRGGIPVAPASAFHDRNASSAWATRMPTLTITRNATATSNMGIPTGLLSKNLGWLHSQNDSLAEPKFQVCWCFQATLVIALAKFGT